MKFTTTLLIAALLCFVAYAVASQEAREQSDAEFFKRVRNFVRKHVNPTNIQKGLDIYNQFRGGDAEESDIWGAIGKMAAKKLGSAALRRLRRDDVEESDAEFFRRVRNFVKKHVNPANIQKGLDIYNQFRGGDAEESDIWGVVGKMAAKKLGSAALRRLRRDDVEETDAEFFKRLRRLVTPANIQKGLDIYRTVRGGDDVEETDAEFLNRVGGFVRRHATPTNIGRGVQLFNHLRRDEEESDADFFKRLRRLVTPANIQKGLNIYNQIRGGDAEESDIWGVVGKMAAKKLGSAALRRLRRDDVEESDAEFFRRVRNFVKKHVNPTNIQKGLDIYNQFRGGDDVEASG